MFAAVTASTNAQSSVQESTDCWAQAYNGHSRADLVAVYTADAHLMMHGAGNNTGRGDIAEFWVGDGIERYTRRC
jgi:ketosteroid isomerase-like protein